MITRKLAKFLRGHPGPLQIYSATLIGCLLGFGPTIGQGPVLYLVLVALLTLINANLLLAGLCLVGAQLLQWALLPWLFSAGIVLVDGAARPVIERIVNAPLGAWSGLEYYVVLPGLLLGALLGCALGWAVVRTVRGYETMVGRWKADTGTAGRLRGKRVTRIGAWLLFGGMPGDEKVAAAQPRALRPLGVLLAVLVCVFAILVLRFFDPAILTPHVREALSRVNQASVDIATLDGRPFAGHLAVSQLAVADRADLTRNTFAADQLTLSLATGEWLRRRMVIRSVVLANPRGDEARGYPASPFEPYAGWQLPAMPRMTAAQAGEFDVLNLIEGGQLWRQRLQTWQGYYEQWVGSPAVDGDAAAPAGDAASASPTLRQRLQAQAAATGYAAVASPQLRRLHPRIELLALDLPGYAYGDQVLDIAARNVSDAPQLQAAPGSLTIANTTHNWELACQWQAAASGAVAVTAAFTMRDLAIARLKERLARPDSLPIDTGWVDIEVRGTVDPRNLDLPVQLHLRDLRLRVAGKPVELASLQMTARLTGSLANPRLRIDSDAWQQALKAAAGDQLRDTIQRQIEQRTGIPLPITIPGLPRR
jgi:hypothetical protein